MQLVGVLGVDHPQHLVVRLVERGALAKQPEPPADPVDVGVDRDLGTVEGEDQDAGSGLSPHPGKRGQEVDRVVARRVGEPVEVGVLAAAAQDLLDARGLGVARPPGRIASITSETGASRTSSQVSKRSRRRS